MAEIRIELPDHELDAVVKAARCSDMLGAAGFVREAVLAAARKRRLFDEAVERVCERSRGVLEVLEPGDGAPASRPPRAEHPPVPSVAPLDEDEVRWAARCARFLVSGSATVFDQRALEDVLAEHGLTDGLDVFEQAATLLVGLAHRAPFVKGNRRAAWAAATAFLDLSGFRFHSWGFDQEAAARIVTDAAEGKADPGEVARRLRGIWLRDGDAETEE